MTFDVTESHLSRAHAAGEERAIKEIEKGYEEPLDDLFGKQDKQDFLFRITGQKIEPDSEDAILILDSFETGYYDWWDSNG